ncbi:MAG: hypothetical protein EP338_00130 [Bacteroidetes bacterium]|nr:MAG: hypothetical protein EP338_00130 [Bacteroidota bacterium]
MKIKKGGYLITPKDIMMLTGVSTLRTAQRHHLSVRDAYGIKGKCLSIRRYCEFNDLDYEFVIEFLNEHR